MAVVPQPDRWFVLQEHVTDSTVSKVVSCISGGNKLLGNLFKNLYG